MTVAQERVGMPLDAFMRAFDQEGAFEILDGEMIPKLPTGATHSIVILRFFRVLDRHCDSTRIGIVIPEATFILPERHDSKWVTGSRTPDLMFFLMERLKAYESENPDWGDGRPFVIIPDVVVEVISPNDKYPEVIKKVSLYLEDGVQMVIVLDPTVQGANVYYQDAASQHLKQDDTLDGGTIIPGFRVSLSALFSPKLTE